MKKGANAPFIESNLTSPLTYNNQYMYKDDREEIMFRIIVASISMILIALIFFAW